MDWRAINFDWNRARAFLVTAEEGSLSAAARALGMAQPTLGRQVDALEQELGVLLFDRTGRGLVLTPSGLDLLDHVRRMGEAAGGMSLAATGRSENVEGSVAITVSDIDAGFLLPPIVARLRRDLPGIEIEIVSANEAVDLRRREADIAVRNFRPTQPDLIAKKVGEQHGRLYASRSYLARIGTPRTREDLAKADFIAFDNTTRFIDALNAQGIPVTRGNFKILSPDHLVQWALVRQGVGIGAFPDEVAATDPDIIPALPDIDVMSFPVWLVTHRELNTSRRVRLVFDILAEELARAYRPKS